MKALERLREYGNRSIGLRGMEILKIAAEIESEFKHEQQLRDSALKELDEAQERIAELEKRLENSVELPKDENGNYITWERLKAVCDIPSLELYRNGTGEIKHLLGWYEASIEFDKFAAYEKKHRENHGLRGIPSKVEILP